MFGSEEEREQRDERDEREEREERNVYERTDNRKDRVADEDTYENIKTNLDTLYKVIIYRNRQYKQAFSSESNFGLILKIVSKVLYNQYDQEKSFISKIHDVSILLTHLAKFGNEESINPVLYLIGYDLALKNETDATREYQKMKNRWDKMPYDRISHLGVIRYYRRWKTIL